LAAQTTLNTAPLCMGFVQDVTNLLTDPGKGSIVLRNPQINVKLVKNFCASMRKEGGQNSGLQLQLGTILRFDIQGSTRVELILDSHGFWSRQYI
jgi:hypothetical protein